MNSKTFARLMLLLPVFTFVGWVGSLVIYGGSINYSSIIRTINSSWNTAAIYGIIPYGFLVTCLLVWSRKKTIEEIRETFNLAPLMLMFLDGAVYLLLALHLAALGENAPEGQEVALFVVVALISVPVSLIAGYVFVGMSILIYKLFQTLRLIRD